jgi:ABC-type cobalamin/Fe3+-siderophores transport system ATPase subunit
VKTSAPQDTLLCLENAALAYGRHVVLRNVSLSVWPGDTISIIGPNGSGKTTLLKVLCGLKRPLSGAFHRRRGLRYGFVGQRHVLDPIFPFRVRDVIAMGRYGQLGVSARFGAEDRRIVTDVMTLTETMDLRDWLFRELSDGQKQRVLIARALVCEPDILLLDEPTNDLDIKHQTQTMALLGSIHRDTGVAILFVTHFLPLALNHAQQVVFIHQEQLTCYDRDHVLQNNPLPSIYDIDLRVANVDGEYVVISRTNDSVGGRP